MGDYFSPWRRKIGVVTLLMACMFAAGWVRSMIVSDTFHLISGMHTQEFLYSDPQFLSWVTFESNDPAALRPALFGHHSQPNHRPFTYWENNDVEWQVHWLGFGAGRFKVPLRSGLRKGWFISYSLITIPLTLISLWLLLSKPRKTNPNKITEPNPVEVA